MDPASLYDDDILAWSEQQAAALRSLKGRRDLPNQLDLTNVLEEIEDVGRSELHAVEGLVENILVHLICLWADPDAPSARGWHAEITAWRVAVRRRLTPSMPGKIDMDAAWHDAVTVACDKIAVWDEVRAETCRDALAESRCPLALTSLVAEMFAPLQAVDGIQSVARPPSASLSR